MTAAPTLAPLVSLSCRECLEPLDARTRPACCTERRTDGSAPTTCKRCCACVTGCLWRSNDPRVHERHRVGRDVVDGFGHRVGSFLLMLDADAAVRDHGAARHRDELLAIVRHARSIGLRHQRGCPLDGPSDVPESECRCVVRTLWDQVAAACRQAGVAWEERS